MSKFVRYVFYRLTLQQRNVIPNKLEAVLSALVYMSITPAALLTLLDTILAKVIDTPPLIVSLGKWQYGLLVMGIVLGDFRRPQN